MWFHVCADVPHVMAAPAWSHTGHESVAGRVHARCAIRKLVFYFLWVLYLHVHVCLCMAVCAPEWLWVTYRSVCAWGAQACLCLSPPGGQQPCSRDASFALSSPVPRVVPSGGWWGECWNLERQALEAEEGSREGDAGEQEGQEPADWAKALGLPGAELGVQGRYTRAHQLPKVAPNPADEEGAGAAAEAEWEARPGGQVYSLTLGLGRAWLNSGGLEQLAGRGGTDPRRPLGPRHCHSVCPVRSSQGVLGGPRRWDCRQAQVGTVAKSGG